MMKGLERVVSFLLVLFGLIISMCETPELDKQVMTMFIGAGMMFTGAVLGFNATEVRDGNTR